MFRSEVVRSKNLKKSIAYKVISITALLIIVLIILIGKNWIGLDNNVVQWFNDQYRSVINPILMSFVGIILIFSMVTSSLIRSPKPLGSIEIDENGIRFLNDKQMIDNIPMGSVESIVFEFFSLRNSSNPAGCMNYLTIKTRQGKKKYEIIVENELNKSELAEVLLKINEKIPVRIRYAHILKSILKDKDFKGLKAI